MKNKKDERERFLFRVISVRQARRTQLVSRIMILSVSAWIFAVIPMSFGESFPNWPTVAEMDEIVRLGTACAKGLNERCWATQYSTNPVAYRVAPFTNNTEFYLDKNLMGTMASKIKSLVPYYVDPDSVYNGTTNIVMLTVTGLWAQLQIGNYGPHIVTNLGIVSTNYGADFTATPAIGTNVATYGDNPWRIYVAALQERYKVLNALKITGVNKAVQDIQFRRAYGTSLYVNAVVNWPDSVWQNIAPYGQNLNNYVDNYLNGPWDISKQRGKIKFDGNTSVDLISMEYWVQIQRMIGSYSNFFLAFEAPAPEGKFVKIFTSTTASFISDYLNNSDAVIPDPGYGTAYQWNASWYTVNPKLLGHWKFNYCTVPLE